MEGLFRRRIAKLVLMGLAALAVAASAAAYGAAPAHQVAVASFASGFPAVNRVGPTGITLDGAGSVFVADHGNLYRFGSGGGTAATHVLNSSKVFRLFGLAFGRSGQLYAARWTGGRAGELVELDPGDGSFVRTVATGLTCPGAVAVDPLSGDVFVSELSCANKVVRVSSGHVSTYVSGIAADGLTFGRDGTLYVAHDPDADGNTISAVTGTDSAHPGTRTGLAAISNADGIALAAADSAGGGPAFLVVNRRNGAITRLELDGSGTTHDLMTGGSRGDFVAAGPDGCLYATQSDSVLKVTNANGSCRDDDALTPTPTGAATGGGSGGSAGSGPRGLGGGLAPTSVASASSACPANRRIIVRYDPRWKPPHHRARVRRARIYVKGHYNRTVSGRALRRRRGVTVRRLPALPFRLTIRVNTKRGNRVVVARRYGRCAGTVVKPKH
jgi:hypothetical protein